MSNRLFATTTLLCCLLVVIVVVSLSEQVSAAVTPYNATEATRAWYFCKLNSCDPTQIMNGFSCPVCKDIQRLFGETLTNLNVFYHEKAMAHGWVGYSPQRNQIIVSFRGTRDIQWFYDLDFKFVPLPGCLYENCYVHQGFYEIYQVLQPNITSHVTKLLNQYGGATVTVNGHSLGASLSSVCVWDLLFNLKAPVTSAINFGEPRVWSYNASLWVSSLMIQAGTVFNRMTWAKDPVPNVPLLSMGYWHASTGDSQIWYQHNSTASYVQCHDGPGFEDLTPSCYFVNVPLQESVPDDHGYYMGIRHGCDN
jgi:hypothetical protein